MWGVLIEGKREKGAECSVLCGMHWNGLTISSQASLCDSSTDGLGNKYPQNLSELLME